MRKHVNSFWFKAINFIICGLAIVGCIGGIAGMLIYGMMPEKSEVYDIVNGNIAGNYSAQMIGQLINGDLDSLDSCENNTNMRYAIIKSSEASYSKLTASNSTYIYGGSDAIKKGKYINRYVDNGSKNIPGFNLINVLCAMEYYNEYSDWKDESYSNVATISQVAIDVENAQFCVFAGDYVYLPQKVEVTLDDINGFTTKTFILSDEATEFGEYKDFYTGETLTSEIIESWIDNDSDESIDYVQVYGTGSNCLTCNYYEGSSSSVYELAVHSIVNLDKEELPKDSRIVDASIQTKDVIENISYYYVVAWIDDNYVVHDYFTEAKSLVDLAMTLGKYAWLLEVISAIVFIVTAFILCLSVGRRPNDNDIVLRWVDKVPFAIYTCVIFIIEGLLIAGALAPFELSMTNYAQVLVVVFECTMAGIYLGLYYLAGIITRIKAHVFMRYTLWHYFMIPFKKLNARIKTDYQRALENTPLFGKMMLAFVVVFIVELVTILLSASASDAISFAPIILWLILIKIVEFGAIFKVVTQFDTIDKGTDAIISGDTEYKVDTSNMFSVLKKHGDDVNRISDGINLAVEERIKSERMRTELITNVSHDIKTPLTSIINYVDLIKKENFEDETMTAYVEVLDRQSVRLKKLLEDLLEASKASTGNIEVNLEEMDVAILLNQLVGEYTERFEAKNLSLVMDTHGFEQMYIKADGRHIWRVFDNLLNNICKYAMEGTRVYIDIDSLSDADTDLDGTKPTHVKIVFKNISATQLNISSDELMERFVRGDSSRNTEGSGLGLSIAQSLMKVMGGDMKLEVDGDLFKVVLTI